MALFAYAVGTVLLCAAAWRTRSRFILFLLQFLPFVFLFAFLWLSQSGYKTLQVRKLGYEFDKTTGDYKNPARVVTLGGDRKGDDLFLEGIPAKAVRIIPSLQDESFEVEAAAGGVLIERNGRLLNAVELKNGDSIAVAGTELQFQGGGSRSRALRAADREWKWPARKWENRRIRRPDLGRSLEEQFYSLSDISRQIQKPVKSAAVLGLTKLQLEWSRKPVRMNRVFIAGYEPGTAINSIPAPIRWKCDGGDTLRFFTLQGREGAYAARRVETITVRNSEFLSLLDPAPSTLGMREDLLQASGSAPLLLTTTELPNSAFPAITYADESERFNGIVAFVQTPRPTKGAGMFQKLQNDFKEKLALNTPRFEVVTNGGVFQPAAGETIALGKSDRMLFRLDRVRFPWAMLTTFLIFLFVRSLFHAPLFRPVENLSATLLLVIVDFFLTTRLLFAFRAASLYPFSQEAVPLALLAWLLVPYLIFTGALLIRNAWQRSELLHFGAYGLLAAGTGVYLLPSYAWLVVALVGISFLAAFLRIHPRSPLLKHPEMFPDFRNRSFGYYLAIPAIVALIAQLTGIGEAMQLGSVRLPLALLYHPLLLWLVSRALWDFYNRLVVREDLTFATTLLSGARIISILAVFFLISFFSTDLGFFLIFCVPVLFIMFGIAAMYMLEYELPVKTAGALLALPVLSVLLLFSSYSTIHRLLPDSYFQSRTVQRILLAVDPEALEETGLVAAERQLGHQRMFLAYARSGWFGEGYGKRAISPALSGTALNDNVPSVFLLNDFGAAGFAAVCLILMAMGMFWVQALRSQEPSGNMPIHRGFLLSLTAIATWIYAALYMLLANCGVLLFTGKNVFLWGLNSTSDVFHSAGLLAFAILPIARAAEARASEPALVPSPSQPAVVGEAI